MRRKVVVKEAEFIPGAPMEARPGVKDWKIIYPETGTETKTLIMGLVEVEPGQHTPLHRHNRAIFLIVAAAFLADSWLGVTDAVARMHADYFFSTFAWAKRLHFRTWYYIFVAILTVITCTTMLIAAPGPLLLAGGILNFFAMSIYMPLLIYLNYFMVPKKFPEWTRPKNATLVVTSIVSVLYLALSIWYLTVKF